MSSHPNRARNLGPRAVRGFRAVPIEERFWSKVDRNGGPDACWPWKGHRLRTGYGIFMVSKSPHVKTTAHRFALQLTIGPIGERYACHRCDNPPCCNPAHLFAGTAIDNMRDARRKDRLPRGSRHPESKLTEEQVAEMRRLRAGGVLLRVLAARYGVAEPCVSRICNHTRRAS